MFSLHEKIVLGSNSPRRKEILRWADIPFDVWPIEWEEVLPESHAFTPEEITTYLAEQKAHSVRERLQGELLITADTLVFLDDKQLGKPRDREEAFQMLQALAGKMHRVITGVCLMNKDSSVTFWDETKVWFRLFGLKEIEYYLDHYKPMDKAGAYGAQEWLGLIGVERIEGSYFNVMGLPIHKVYDQLKYFSEHQK